MFSFHSYQWLSHGDIRTIKHKVPDTLFPTIPEWRAFSFVPQAGKGHFSHYSNDPVRLVEKKPRWWWRFLACIFYLRPLHETWWVYAEPAYHLHPVLEDLEFLTVPFRGAMSRLPYWFHIVAYLLSY